MNRFYARKPERFNGKKEIFVQTPYDRRIAVRHEFHPIHNDYVPKVSAEKSNYRARRTAAKSTGTLYFVYRDFSSVRDALAWIYYGVA